MKLVIQKVKKAKVEVEDKTVGQIEKGYMVLLGVKKGDTKENADYLARKLCNLRIFEDENGKMNLSIKDVNGELLIISQFTLYGNTKDGNRPSFIEAEEPEKANRLYECFMAKCKENGIEVTGSVFTKNSKQLKENIEYIKQNYGEEYLTNLIVSKNLKHLQKTLPYLQSIGALETTKTSASILLLTLEEIKERQAFIKNIGETIVIDGKFNRIFGMPKKRYQKKVKEYEEKKKLIGKIKGAIQEGQELDEQINHKKQEQK